MGFNWIRDLLALIRRHGVIRSQDDWSHIVRRWGSGPSSGMRQVLEMPLQEGGCIRAERILKGPSLMALIAAGSASYEVASTTEEPNTCKCHKVLIKESTA